MNEPRTTPFEFRVFIADRIVWLFDDSERTYLCSTQPSIYAEPLYALNGEDLEIGVEADYFSARTIAQLETTPIDTYAADTDDKEAWDDAREEANANHRL